jgi:hypothetical protein
MFTSSHFPLLELDNQCILQKGRLPAASSHRVSNANLQNHASMLVGVLKVNLNNPLLNCDIMCMILTPIHTGTMTTTAVLHLMI